MMALSFLPKKKPDAKATATGAATLSSTAAGGSTTQLANLAKPQENAFTKQLKALSNREKYLIVGLFLIIIILALVVLLILPAQERSQTAASTLQEAISNKATTDQEIATLPIYQASLDRSKARYDEYVVKYQAPMQPEDIDRMLTTLIEECGFTASSLTLHPVALEAVPYFEAVPPAWVAPTLPEVAASNDTTSNTTSGLNADSKNAAATDATNDPNAADSPNANANAASSTGTDTSSKTNAQQNAQSSSGTATVAQPAAGAADPGSGPGAQVYAVELTVTGNESNFFTFLDRVVPLTWLKILTESYTPPSNFDTYSTSTAYQDPDSQVFSFSLKIYINPNATVKTP